MYESPSLSHPASRPEGCPRATPLGIESSPERGLKGETGSYRLAKEAG